MGSFRKGDKVMLVDMAAIAIRLSGRYELYWCQEAVVEEVLTYVDGHKKGQQFARVVWYVVGKRQVAGVSVENLRFSVPPIR
jgi:hypothetical protein